MSKTFICLIIFLLIPSLLLAWNLVTISGVVGDANTVLLLHLDTDFADSSSSNHTVTASGNTYISGTNKFGGGSAYFDGSGYLNIPSSSDFAIGSSDDVTVDFWYYHGTDGVNQRFFSAALTNEFACYLNDGDGKPICVFNTEDVYPGPTSVKTVGWHHIAMVRSNGQLATAVDGVFGTWYADTNIYTGGLYVGGYCCGGYNANGYIDEFRISKGVARWTANFTPPTAPY